MAQLDAISMAKGGITQLVEEVNLQIKTIEDVNKQMTDSSVIINNFVLQTLGAVSDNKDLSEVNQLLVNSLIQIKDFSSERPAVIRETKGKLEQKLDAYEQCILIIDEAVTTSKEADEQKMPDDKKKE